MISGLDDLNSALDALPDQLRRNILRGAAHAAAGAVRDIAKGKAAGLRTPEVKAGGVVKRPSESVPDAIKAVDSSRGDLIKAKVVLRGFPASVGIWAEFGTLGHFIRVREDVRPTAKTRRGMRALGIRTINEAVRRGSLVIGQNYVGATVYHPGAKAAPFMTPAADEGMDAAGEAAAEYIRARFTKAGLTAPAPSLLQDEEAA